jgi:hypothetical protein
MRTFGKNLSTLHRELGMQLTIKAGEFDRIVQPYACDSSALPRILQTDLQRETPHPDYRNMFLDEVDVTRDVAGIARMRATYFGIAGGGDEKPPEISVKSEASVRYFDGSITTRLFITKKFVSSVEPLDDVYIKKFSLEDFGVQKSSSTIVCWQLRCWNENWKGGDFQCLAQDWTKIGAFYEVIQQFEGRRFTKPNT